MADNSDEKAQEALPLVVMMDFLNEAVIEQRALEGVACVESWNLHSNNAIPPRVLCQL